MDQFDNEFNKMNQPSKNTTPSTMLIVGKTAHTVNTIRASLESYGHVVKTTKKVSGLEDFVKTITPNIVFVCLDNEQDTQLLFETISLLTPTTTIVGYSLKPHFEKAITFIRQGGEDVLHIPSDLDCINNRITVLLQQQHNKNQAEISANKALRLCDKINEERHRVEEENESLQHKLANVHCETQKKIQQIAIGAEFQTLVSQELEIESMLRTALEYMLKRVGATNAAVYLREGEMDWGIGAYINFDRQPEQFQSLIETMGQTICHQVSTERTTRRYANGESFAVNMDPDQIDFSGNEVITCPCFKNNRCMAVLVLFRDESRTFDSQVLETIETIQGTFGEQLGKILKIHRRAESRWPSESIDDDDWSIDKAA